jgi:hypothetical protein
MTRRFSLPGDEDAIRAGRDRMAAAVENPLTPEERAWVCRLRSLLKKQPDSLSLVPHYDSLGIVKDCNGVAAPVDSVSARLKDD